jgi:hypothetical protein
MPVSGILVTLVAEVPSSGGTMIKDGWFFLVAGIIGILSSLFDKKSPLINDVDGNDATEEDKEKYRPTLRGRLISGLIGVAAAIYGWHLLRK